MAVRKSGGEKIKERAVVGCRRLGRHCSQDGAFDPVHEEQNSRTDAMESCSLIVESFVCLGGVLRYIKREFTERRSSSTKLVH